MLYYFQDNNLHCIHHNHTFGMVFLSLENTNPVANFSSRSVYVFWASYKDLFHVPK